MLPQSLQVSILPSPENNNFPSHGKVDIYFFIDAGLYICLQERREQTLSSTIIKEEMKILFLLQKYHNLLLQCNITF